MGLGLTTAHLLGQRLPEPLWAETGRTKARAGHRLGARGPVEKAWPPPQTKTGCYWARPGGPSIHRHWPDAGVGTQGVSPGSQGCLPEPDTPSSGSSWSLEQRLPAPCSELKQEESMPPTTPFHHALGEGGKREDVGAARGGWRGTCPVQLKPRHAGAGLPRGPGTGPIQPEARRPRVAGTGGAPRASARGPHLDSGTHCLRGLGRGHCRLRWDLGLHVRLLHHHRGPDLWREEQQPAAARPAVGALAASRGSPPLPWLTSATSRPLPVACRQFHASLALSRQS